MKKVMKIAGISFLIVIVLLTVAFGFYWYRNIHWYDKYEKALKKAGVQEKQVTLESGKVINYGEVANDKPALLLIHGQMSIWEDYALVLSELSKNWHIYAVDVYGHGESSHDESLYYLDVNGDDLIWFSDHVIGGSTVVSGHSNGAITAAYIAAYGGGKILPAWFWKIRRYSLQKEKAGKTALRIWMHINRSMSTMPPTNLSVGKPIISDIAIGDNCL